MSSYRQSFLCLHPIVLSWVCRWRGCSQAVSVISWFLQILKGSNLLRTTPPKKKQQHKIPHVSNTSIEKKMGWVETSYIPSIFWRNNTLWRIFNLEGSRMFMGEKSAKKNVIKFATGKKKRCETNLKRGKCHDISILYHMGEHFGSFELTLSIYMLRLTIFKAAHPNQTTKWGWCFWSYTKIRIWKLEW